LREIKSNENGLWTTALVIIERMKAIESCPRLVDIYYEVGKFKDDEWNRAVVSTLMKLRYLPPKDLYRNYVLKCLKRNLDSFYLLVEYCNVDPVEALPLLSGELVDNILSEEVLSCPIPKIGKSLQGVSLLIAYLIIAFKSYPDDYLPQLLELVNLQKPKAALYLKEVVANYLDSEFA
jgi:hypothetical protein